MFLTETGIQEGNVEEQGMLILILTFSTQPAFASGIRSLKDTQDVMSNQKLRCSFPFSQLSFDTEIGFILLVEGKQSPFFTVSSPSICSCSTISLVPIPQTDISLPLQPRSKGKAPLYKNQSEIKMPDQGQLDAFRNLLIGARRRARPNVPKNLAEVGLIY